MGEKESKDSEVTTSPAAHVHWVCLCVCSLGQVTPSLGLRSFCFTPKLGLTGWFRGPSHPPPLAGWTARALEADGRLPAQRSPICTLSREPLGESGGVKLSVQRSRGQGAMTVTMTAWVTTGPCAHSEGPGQKLSPPPHALPPLSTPPPTLCPPPSAVLTGSFTKSCRPSPRRRSCRYAVASRCCRQLFSRPCAGRGHPGGGTGEGRVGCLVRG